MLIIWGPILMGAPKFYDTGVGSWGGAGICSPPTNLRQWVSETRCEIKLTAVIHSGVAQKCIESFFAPAPRRTATVVQGKLALPSSWRMPRLQNTWRRGLCRTIHLYLYLYLHLSSCIQCRANRLRLHQN